MPSGKKKFQKGAIDLLIILGIAALLGILPIAQKLVGESAENRGRATGTCSSTGGACSDNYPESCDAGSGPNSGTKQCHKHGTCTCIDSNNSSACCSWGAGSYCDSCVSNTPVQCGSTSLQCSCNTQGSTHCIGSKNYSCGNDCCYHEILNDTSCEPAQVPTIQPSNIPVPTNTPTTSGCTSGNLGATRCVNDDIYSACVYNYGSYYWSGINCPYGCVSTPSPHCSESNIPVSTNTPIPSGCTDPTGSGGYKYCSDINTAKECKWSAYGYYWDTTSCSHGCSNGNCNPAPASTATPIVCDLTSCTSLNNSSNCAANHQGCLWHSVTSMCCPPGVNPPPTSTPRPTATLTPIPASPTLAAVSSGEGCFTADDCEGENRCNTYCIGSPKHCVWEECPQNCFYNNLTYSSDQRRCVSEGSVNYYVCVAGNWQTGSCTSGRICQNGLCNLFVPSATPTLKPTLTSSPIMPTVTVSPIGQPIATPAIPRASTRGIHCQGSNLMDGSELVDSCNFGCNTVSLECNPIPANLACATGGTRCNNGMIQHCDAQLGIWTNDKRCENACNPDGSANCKPMECTPQQVKCLDDYWSGKCKADRSGWEREYCEFGCLNGNCQPYTSAVNNFLQLAGSGITAQTEINAYMAGIATETYGTPPVNYAAIQAAGIIGVVGAATAPVLISAVGSAALSVIPVSVLAAGATYAPKLVEIGVAEAKLSTVIMGSSMVAQLGIYGYEQVTGNTFDQNLKAGIQTAGNLGAGLGGLSVAAVDIGKIWQKVAWNQIIKAAEEAGTSEELVNIVSPGLRKLETDVSAGKEVSQMQAYLRSEGIKIVTDRPGAFTSNQTLYTKQTNLIRTIGDTMIVHPSVQQGLAKGSLAAQYEMLSHGAHDYFAVVAERQIAPRENPGFGTFIHAADYFLSDVIGNGVGNTIGRFNRMLNTSGLEFSTLESLFRVR